MQVKLGGERFGKRLCARAAGVNQGAVNIEENEPNHARAS
jgi:hypothetical protein